MMLFKRRLFKRRLYPMKLPAWPTDEGPFHAGEQAAQALHGVREAMAETGRRVIRTVMPLQHRELFRLLPFIALSGVDARGQPQATLLAGRPGFVTAPDQQTLRVDALPPGGDPLAAVLAVGAQVAVLGIELPTRRRNRANGVVMALDANGFTVRVRQSFGNCPRYIQVRELLRPAPEAGGAAAPPRQSDRLDAISRALARSADTFFIATHAAGDRASGGSDISHRGGRPGFVRVGDDGRTLVWPEFAGNLYFNTLGNLLLQARAAIVVPDFERGDLLHVSGRCEIEWAGREVEAFAGAQHLVRMSVDQVLLRPAAWPLRWRLIEPSPWLLETGRWE
jgi:predicted pyridoxine 5'-phosphate oxidase superfamily flavin-nucleotide-binding protein